MVWQRVFRTGAMRPVCILWRCVAGAPQPVQLACSSSGTAPGYEDLPPLSGASEVVKRNFDLQFASQRDWNKATVAEMVSQLRSRRGDTGSTPVQVGTLTVRIKYLTEHMKRNKKDKDCLRSLLQLLHRRRKLLFYLQRTDFQRYHQLLQELNLRTPKVQKYAHKYRK